MCETFTNFRKRKAFEKMLIVKSQFARSNSDTDLILSMKKQKDLKESRTDYINLEKQFNNKNYNPKKTKYVKLLNQDKIKLSQFIQSNTSNLRLYGNKRYNEYHPYLFVRDQEEKIPNSKIGLLPLPMKSRKKLKTKEEIKKFKEVERSIVMMRRIQYTRKITDTGKSSYGKTIDISCIIRIQRWWRLMLKIIKIQRQYKARCRRREAKLFSRLSDFLGDFDKLLNQKMKKNCIRYLYNYTKWSSVINNWAFNDKKILRLSVSDFKKIVKIQSLIRYYLQKLALHKHFELSKHKVNPILGCSLITKYPKHANIIVAMNKRRIMIHWRKYLRNKNKMQRIVLAPNVITKKSASYPSISAKKIEFMYKNYSRKVELAIGKYSNEDVMRFKKSQPNYYFSKAAFLDQINKGQTQSSKLFKPNKNNDSDYYKEDISDDEELINNENASNKKTDVKNAKDKSNDEEINLDKDKKKEQDIIEIKKTSRDEKTDNSTSKYEENNALDPHNIFNQKDSKGESFEKNTSSCDDNTISRLMVKQLYKYERKVGMITKMRFTENVKSIITIQRRLKSSFLTNYKRQTINVCYINKVWIKIITQSIITLSNSLTKIMAKSYFSKKTRCLNNQKYFKPSKNDSYALNEKELDHLVLFQREFKTYYAKNNTPSIMKPKQIASSTSITKSNVIDINFSISLIQQHVRMLKLLKQSCFIVKKELRPVSFVTKQNIIDCYEKLCYLQIQLKEYLYTGKIILYDKSKENIMTAKHSCKSYNYNNQPSIVPLQSQRSLLSNYSNLNNELMTNKTKSIMMGLNSNAMNNSYIFMNESNLILNHPKSSVCYISMTKIEKSNKRILNIQNKIMQFNNKVNSIIKEAKRFIKPMKDCCSIITKERFDISGLNISSSIDKYSLAKRELSTLCMVTKTRIENHTADVIRIQSYYKNSIHNRSIYKRKMSIYNDSCYSDNLFSFADGNTMITRRDMKSSSCNQSLFNNPKLLIYQNEQHQHDDKHNHDHDQNQFQGSSNAIDDSIQLKIIPTWYITKERKKDLMKNVNYIQQQMRHCFNKIRKPSVLSVSLITKVNTNPDADMLLIKRIQNNVKKYLMFSVFGSSSSRIQNQRNQKSQNSFRSLMNKQDSYYNNCTQNISQSQSTIHIPIKVDTVSISCMITKSRRNDQYRDITFIQNRYLKHLNTKKEQKDIDNRIPAKILNPLCYLLKTYSYNFCHLTTKPIFDYSFFSKEVYYPTKQTQSIKSIQRSFRANKSQLNTKNKMKQNNFATEIVLDYFSPTKPILCKMVYQSDAYIEKEYRRLIIQPDLTFLSLLNLFATKNSQEYIFNIFTKKPKPDNFTYPSYITAIERHVKFIKSSQSKDSKVKEVFNDIFPNENVRNLHEQISQLPKAKIKQLHSINIYHSIEPDLINYLNSFCAYDKRLTNSTFISERLKQNKINNTNIFGLTRLIDEEYNSLLNGKYCHRCYFSINSCHCALQDEEDDLFGDDSMMDSMSKNRSNHFEYDTTTCKGIVINRKPKIEEGYEDPLTQMICISDDQLIKKLQIKTSALVSRGKHNGGSDENAKEEMKLINTTEASVINKEGDMNNFKQLIMKQTYTQGNSNDKSDNNYLEFDYNAEEEK